MNRRVVWSFRVDEDVLARARGTLLGLQRLEPGWTMARFLEEAVEAHMATLQAKHNGGQPWPPTHEALPSGQPLGRATR